MTTLKQIANQGRVELSATKQNRWLGTAVALGSVSLASFLTALTMPYGPITTAQVWIVMASSLIIRAFNGV